MSARWLLLVPLLAACEVPTPRDDYDDFVERTAGRRGRTDAGTGSTYYDLRGRWLVNTKLTAPIQDMSEIADPILQRTPMGRWGEPGEMIGTALFLASANAAGFITGVTIPVDGGYCTL